MTWRVRAAGLRGIEREFRTSRKPLNVAFVRAGLFEFSEMPLSPAARTLTIKCREP